MRSIWLALLLAGVAAPALSCGGSGKGAAEPAGGAAGDPSGGAPEPPEPECCCQRYNEDGDPTGAAVADESACKSSGGTCTEDQTQCDNE